MLINADNDESANNDNQEVADTDENADNGIQEVADNADNDENADNGIQEVAGERSNPIQANAFGIFNTTATFVVIIAFEMTIISFDFLHLYLAPAIV